MEVVGDKRDISDHQIYCEAHENIFEYLFVISKEGAVHVDISYKVG